MSNTAHLVDTVCAAWSKVLPIPYGTKEFAPHDGITYCNAYVEEVCRGFDYPNFQGLLANGMFDYMKNHPMEWTEITPTVAQQHANAGGLVIAGWQNDKGPHGHVSVVFPGLLVFSDKWQESCPKLANVGEMQTSKIGVGANWCFGEKPSYFVLNFSLSQS